MANLLKALLKKTVFRADGGLVSLENPYRLIGMLLASHSVTGILDAGASHGRVSRRLSRLFPRAQVYGFEPHPMYRQELESYAKKDPRFEANFLALSDAGGFATLRIAASPGSTSLFAPGARLAALYPQQSQITKTVEVETVTIDDWAAARGGVEIQLMKFDIQGGELKAIQGARQQLQSATLLVYTEIFFNPLYDGGATFGEIDQALRQFGFLLYTMVKPRSDPNGMLIQANAIYVHKQRMGL